MKTEAGFYQQMKTATKRLRPELSLTRIENWAGQGIPDLLICDEVGRFHFVELKFCKANAVNLSPHQVSWLMRHRKSSSWILIKRQRRPEATPEVFLYRADQAIDVKTDGLKVEPVYAGQHPFPWTDVLGLISPI
jgi:hypothetical protein